jgi:hypothetical protein
MREHAVVYSNYVGRPFRLQPRFRSAAAQLRYANIFLHTGAQLLVGVFSA